MHIFIISWTGVHQKAQFIAETLLKENHQVSIVFSDEGKSPFPDLDCDLIARPNHLFWGDKFSACLEHLNSDSMLVIHADCDTDSWQNLVGRAITMMQKHTSMGVWVPKIEGTNYHLNRIKMADANDDLALVVQPDAIIFALKKPVIDRVKQLDYSKNILGWGIDTIFTAFAYSHNLFVAVDKTIEVFHPVSRGYKTQEAIKQCGEFLTQMTVNEYLMRSMMEAHLFKYDTLQKQAINRDPSVKPE